MRETLLALLRCPSCRARLYVARDSAASAGSPGVGRTPTTSLEGLLPEDGALECEGCSSRFPIRKGIPRFVSPVAEDHFGLQWTRFPRTQLDSHSGHPISQERLLAFSGWKPGELSGRTVLDVGCGAGRFAEVALAFGARVVAVDRSLAVEACQDNLGDRPGLQVVQADLLALPFAPESFDFVYCLGVLQHTPDPRRAFLSLPPLLVRGGRLVVDVYPRLWRNRLWPKYWLRPFTSRLPPRVLHRLVSLSFPLLFPLSLALGRVPRFGRRLRYIVPVADYEGVYALDAAQLREWGFLDTLDMLGARYDKPQKATAVRSWFEEAGLAEVSVFRSGFVVGRGRRP